LQSFQRLDLIDSSDVKDAGVRKNGRPLIGVFVHSADRVAGKADLVRLKQVMIVGAMLGLLLGLSAAQPAAAECFDCNYGLAIYGLASLAVAGVTALIGLGWFITRRRVPTGLIVVLGLSGVPPLALLLLDGLGWL
jgi:hypothetical protein